jgi:acyl-coenzyme A thioesterase PaaI-like protein
VACGDNNPVGLRLKFEKQSDGSVRAAAFCVKELSGYDGLLHGGVAALMLDSAMTNCLFASGVTALTAEMTVKYRAPVSIGLAVILTGAIKSDHDPLFIVGAELSQQGQVKVSAEAKFMRTVG